MLEFEFNGPIEVDTLIDFFARCGWEDAAAGVKLEWALAASDQWVLCRLDGQVVGFGRSCRLDAFDRMVFDVLVDLRFEGGGLRDEIVRLLSAGADALEEVSVFSQSDAFSYTAQTAMVQRAIDLGEIPEAPAGTYLGRKHRGQAGGEE